MSVENEIYYEKMLDEEFMSQFDYRMTYKLNSDIPSPYISWQEDKYLLNPLVRNKTDIVSFIASNCAAVNNRSEYVEELMKYIQVNSFGSCLHNINLNTYLNLTKDTGEKSKMEVLARHKFYLAFENANIQDYVSEKFWGAFRTSTVPVYMGAPNIDDFRPARHSIIKVTDFKNPEDLANYLILLNENDHLYDEYLSWRNQIHFLPSFKNLLKYQKYDPRCRICMAATGKFSLRNGDRIE